MSLNNFNLLAGAIIEGDLSKVGELSHEDAIKAIGSYGETLLHYAAFYDKLEITKFLIECGVNISVRDKGGKLPVDLANELGKTGIANFLRMKQIDYDSKLLAAVYHGYVNQVTDLLIRGANVNVQDDDGRTPLHYAAWQGQLDAATQLVS